MVSELEKRCDDDLTPTALQGGFTEEIRIAIAGLFPCCVVRSPLRGGDVVFTHDWQLVTLLITYISFLWGLCGRR